MSHLDNHVIATRIIVGSSAHAIITTPKRDLSVLLAAGKPAHASLHDTAIELRKQAQDILQRADIIDTAASQLLAEDNVRRTA
jgi:hypothetical protein